MNTLNHLSVAALVAALAAGCASSPQPIAELDNARVLVQQAKADPLAQEAAGMRLKQADDALRLATEGTAQHMPVEQIRQQAYLAGRDAEIAKEQTAELRSRKDLEQGQNERNQVLLEARTNEAALSNSLARSMHSLMQFGPRAPLQAVRKVSSFG